MLRSAPCAVLILDSSEGVVQLNDAARLLLGVSPGEPVRRAVPEWLADAVWSFGGPAAAAGAGLGGTGTAGRRAEPIAAGPIGDGVFEARPVPVSGAPGNPASTAWWLVEVTERERLAGELAAERERTAFLAETSDELLASLNLERCMEVTTRLAARHLADAALVIVPRAGHGHPVAYCGPDGRVDHRDLLIDPMEVEGLADALRGFPPVAPRWIDPRDAPGWIARPGTGKPAAMVVIALPGHGVPAGALVLLRPSGRERFSAGEELTTGLFAGHAGAALSAARLYAEQASITATLMRGLLPPRTQELDGVELAARYRPSGDEDMVGGDFYDVYPDAVDAEAEALVVLGDVCGKGLEAAVLTGKIRNTLRALLPMAGDHRRVLEVLNETLLEDDSTRFVTLVLASARRQDAQVRLRLTSAGHSAPLIVRTDGTVETAATGGSLIGVLEEIDSTTAEAALEPGDACLLYTDGITEAVGGPLGDEMFGDERLRAELGRCGGMPPEALVERVLMLASEWVGAGPHDDMAVIALTAPRHVRSSASGSPGPEGRVP
ncbi:SpoIIE family protein phosphatase [Actinomadura sp. KC345]|uniref:SpoIIE family protein phosphatase n=1 Tax=Actinomadura sp. KC345 TaxID=2530371 RepID=UPI001FB5F10D|nr:SpoIIE family protein phosphatase [Actinomadura sp. KC345]